LLGTKGYVVVVVVVVVDTLTDVDFVSLSLSLMFYIYGDITFFLHGWSSAIGFGLGQRHALILYVKHSLKLYHQGFTIISL
jgi:hypothetical protein